MRIGLLALATTSACARVFGIDELPTPATITIEPLRRFAHDDASGHGVVEAVPATVGDTQVAVVVAGAAVAPAWSTNGTFTFVAPSGTPFAVTVDGVELQDVGTGEPRTFTLDFPTFGRPDAAPVSATTALVFPATPQQSLDDRLYVTGAWEAVRLGDDGGGTSSATFTEVAPLLRASPTLPDLARGDGLLVANYTVVVDILEATSTLSSVATMVQPISPADGAVTLEATTTATIAPDRCASFAPSLATELARFATLSNASEFPISQGELAVRATPSAQLSDRVGFPLASQTTTRDAAFALSYGDPFGRDVLAIARVDQIRTDQPDGDSASYATLAPTSCATPIDFGGPVELAAVPTLGGIALDVGELALALGTSTATLAWEVASPGRVDAYAVAIVSLDTGFQVVRSYVTATRALAIDPTLFAPASRYAIAITSLAGLPNVASGDYATRAYPTARGVTWSSPFTVH